MSTSALQNEIDDDKKLNDPEKANSNEFITNAAERLRKKKVSRTEAETMSLIKELEARRVQLEMNKSFTHENVARPREDSDGLIPIFDHTSSERMLFESALVGIMIFDGATDKILDINSFLTNMLGYSPEELAGKDLWTAGIITGTKESLNRIAELMQKGFSRIDDIHVRTKEGKQLIIELDVSHIIAGNEKVIQLKFHDITERKIADEKLRENQHRLNDLIVTKDKFVSIIAHDLTNSFNSIIGLGNILATKVREKDYAGIEAFAETIHDSSWKAMNLLTNLLVWSRSQTGRIDFCPGHFSIAEVISGVCELFKESAEEKSIDISVDDPQNAIVFCDKEMISTVLRNLISNSLKFTRRGGIIISSVVQDESGTTISIRDSGVGFTNEAIDKLFRVEESFSTNGTEGENGTGMGLLLCKDFIDRHGGKIWVERDTVEGTIINFTLPERQVFRSSNP